MTRTVTVTGHGSAAAIPDAAVVRIAAVHRASTMAEALAGAESARAAAVATADGLVVSSADLSVWPAYDGNGTPSGFEARHSLTITGADLVVAGDLVGRLANEVGDRLQVEGVVLVVSDPSSAAAAAREAAFADARSRADHLAELSGGVLGQVQQVLEGAGAPMARGSEAMSAKADVALSPGQTQVTSMITVTWSLD